MTANARLLLCAILIGLSAVYAYIVAQDVKLAGAVASGYIAVMLTALVFINLWKRP